MKATEAKFGSKEKKEYICIYIYIIWTYVFKYTLNVIHILNIYLNSYTCIDMYKMSSLTKEKVLNSINWQYSNKNIN